MHLHTTPQALATREPVITDANGRGWLSDIVWTWAGRDDVALTVRRIVHCGGCAECETHCDTSHGSKGYVASAGDHDLVEVLNPRCVFPHCARPSRGCDHDHTIAFDPENPGRGPTCPRCNLAPLCRHHHQLKTHAGWAYRQVEPGTFTWTDPHHQRFLTTRWGTTDLTDTSHRAPPDF